MATMAISLALAVGGQVLTQLLKPKQKDTYTFGPRISDLNVPNVSPGNMINRVWGGAKVNTQYLWVAQLKETAHWSDQAQPGGKGSGKSQPHQYKLTYTYAVDIAFGVCRGPVAQVSRIWSQGKLLWTNPAISAATIQAEFDAAYVSEATRLMDLGVPADQAYVSGWVFAYNNYMNASTLTAWSQIGAANYIMSHPIAGYPTPNYFNVAVQLQQLFDPVSLDKKFIPDVIRFDSIVIYNGDETQEPDATMEAAMGVGNVPSYRGLCYVVINNLQLADFGNTVPQFTVEVIKDGQVTYTTTPFANQTPAAVPGLISDSSGAIIGFTGTAISPVSVAGLGTTAQTTSDLSITPPTLNQIIQDVIAEGGLDPTKFEVAMSVNPNSIIQGYVLTQPTNARQILQDLQKIYQFDGNASGYAVKFMEQNQRARLILRWEDLGAHEENEDMPPSLEMTRASDLDLPRRINLKYQEPARNYSMNTVWAERQTTDVLTTEDVDMTIALDRQTAKTLVEQMLVLRMMKRNHYKVRLPRKYIILEPGDVVLIPDKGYVNEWSALRCVQVDIGANQLIEVTFIDANYVQGVAQAIVGTDINVTTPTIQNNSRTYPYLLDCPILSDLIPDGPQFFTVLTGVSQGWKSGALLADLTDAGSVAAYGVTTAQEVAGSAWYSVATGSAPVPCGFALQSLDNTVKPGSWDYKSEVIVRLQSDQWSLTNGNPVDMLTQAINTCYIGGPNTGELAAFANAENLGNGLWRLTKWMRGLRGTDYAMASHTPGEPFVMINTSAVEDVPITKAAIGTKGTFVALSAGETVTDEATFTFTPTGNSLRPYAPALTRLDEATDHSITLEWQPRNRLNGGWADGGDISLDQAVEDYLIDVYAPVAGTLTLIKTYDTGSTRAWSYSAASQIADTGISGVGIVLKLYQVGAIIGRGFPTIITL